MHEATGYTPFYLNCSRHPRTLPTDPITKEGTPAEWYLEEINDITRKAEKSLKKAKEAMKRKWDASKRATEIYHEGDLVLVQVDYLPSNHPSKKLDDKWRGPFHIIAKKGESAYELELPQLWKGH
jgi:ribosomal protein L21E